MENRIYTSCLSVAVAMFLGASQTSWAVEQMSDDQLQSTALPVILVMSVKSSEPATCAALAPSGLISQSLSQAQTLGLLACQQNEENLESPVLSSVNADQFTDENNELISAQADLGDKLDLTELAATKGAGSSDTPLADNFLGSLGFNVTQNDNLAFNNNLTRGSLGLAMDLDDELIDFQVLSFINDQYGLGSGTSSILENILLSNLSNSEFNILADQDFGAFTFRSNLIIDQSYVRIDDDFGLETINLRSGEVSTVVTVNRN
jgi:hypothetical protein